MAARALSFSSSSSSSFGEEEDTFPRPTAEEPRSQDTDGSGVASSDEIGENGVLVNRVPATPKRKGGAKSPLPKKNRGEAAAAAVEEDATSAADSDAETTAPADEATNLDGAILPPQKKEAEEHLKDKSDKYPHLWQMVLTLEKEYSFPLKKAFLKLTEGRAAKLNTKVKNLCLKEVRTQLRRTENDRAVVTALMELIQQSPSQSQVQFLSFWTGTSRVGGDETSSFGLVGI